LPYKDERQALQSFVSGKDAFTGAWRGETAFQGHFIIKGFSDLTACSHMAFRAGACV